MSGQEAMERTLTGLAAASEELLQRLQRRDAGYLEALESRAQLLKQVQRLCSGPSAPPSAAAVLERVRQLGEACEREAKAIREETLAALRELDRQARFAQSLGRLAKPEGPSLLDVNG